MRIFLIILSMVMILPFSSGFAVEFTVSSDKAYDDINPGDGGCSTGYAFPDNCTLRAAIQEANALAGPDRIVFDRSLVLPYPNLPEISESLTIDGSSQWTSDSIGPRPGVEIGAGELVICSDDVVVTGLMFFGGTSGEAGITVECGDNIRIGGPGDNERNVFIVTGTGVQLDNWRGLIGDKVTIQYNYFGIIHKYRDSYGNDNEYRSENGIEELCHGSSNTLVIEHNLIGECRCGIALHCARDVTIRENRIGHPNPYYSLGGFADRFPNGTGIYLFSSSDVTIEHNGIADNINHQVELSTQDRLTRIENNQIGAYHTDYTVFPSHGDGINVDGGVLGSVLEILDNDIVNINGNGISGGAESIKGNRIKLNKKNGILLQGGAGLGQRIVSSNTINSNQESGILLDNAQNFVLGKNRIGVSVGYHPDAGNGLDGIRVVNGSIHNLIGDTVSEAGNRIGFNMGNGIYIGGTGTRDNDVAGNVIGLAEDSAGFRKAGNHKHGIALYDNAEANNIGLSGDIINANIILDSHWRGIAVINSNHNRIFGNLVGTDKEGHNWGNAYSGIQIVGNNNEIKYNTVAFNGYGPSQPQGGIIVQGASSYGNRLSENSIFQNAAAGIELVDGGNQNLQAPLVTRNGLTVSGTTYPSATVEFFSGPEEDEGTYFEGSAQADIAGNFSWQIPGHVRGKYITATVTTPHVFSTSAFSLPVQGYTFPWPMFLPGIINGRN